jgi:hypothetical protein
MARITQFLNARYAQSDVVKSFGTKHGKTIDCIPFMSQPGVEAVLARGLSITQPAAQQIDRASLGDLAGDAFLGDPDDQGRPRTCGDAVPVLRIEPKTIIEAGGLDAFLAAHTRKAPPPELNGAAPPAAPNLGNYAHVQTQSNINSGLYLGSARFSSQPVFNLHIPDHSVAQMWVLDSGTIAGKTLQTVEAGVNSDPGLYGTTFGAYPHLFIWSTKDGYNSTGCYNNVGGTPPCLMWVGAPGAAFTPGQMLSYGSLGSPVEAGINIHNVTGTNAGWQIEVGQSSTPARIGFYPAADYNGTMTTAANFFRVGAEVYDQTANWLSPMGWGSNPEAGRVGAGYVRDYIAYGNGACTANFGGATCWSGLSSERTGYAFQATAAGENGWQDGFYYGNAHHPFDAGNFGYSWSPVGDWASGKYKGECPVNYPLIGLSKFTSSTRSHGVECATYPIDQATTGGSCYRRSVGQAENRGNPGNGDWDANMYKTDCRSNEYVLGVSQTTAGVLDGILCCPVSPAATNLHRACETQLLPNNNPQQPDWDFGYYKGTCRDSTDGKDNYVVGVSTPAPWSGTPGGAHAVLCCHQ